MCFVCVQGVRVYCLGCLNMMLCGLLVLCVCYIVMCLCVLDCDILRGVIWLCGLIVIMCVVTWCVVACFVFWCACVRDLL